MLNTALHCRVASTQLIRFFHDDGKQSPRFRWFTESNKCSNNNFFVVTQSLLTIHHCKHHMTWRCSAWRIWIWCTLDPWVLPVLWLAQIVPWPRMFFLLIRLSLQCYFWLKGNVWICFMDMWVTFSIIVLYLNMFIYHYYDSYCKQQVKRLSQGTNRLQLTIWQSWSRRIHSGLVLTQSFIHSSTLVTCTR